MNVPPTKESGIYSVEQLRRMANEVVSEPGEWHEYTEAFARAFLERDALREALKPFALPLADRQIRRGYVSARLLVSDIRRARAALERPE